VSSVHTIAFVLLVCWALALIGVIVLVARKFASWDRDDDKVE
jgi:hypothetical protein